MSKSKTKEESVRLAWIAALRSQGDRQRTGEYSDSEDVGVCALGLLAEVAGTNWRALPDGYPPTYGRLAGLNNEQSCEVVLRNDGDTYPKHTFSEIADVIESWFPPA